MVYVIEMFVYSKKGFDGRKNTYLVKGQDYDSHSTVTLNAA